MRARLTQDTGTRLEGLCSPTGGMRIVHGRGADGIERVEAHLSGRAFAPHRHGTYAIGITLSGVQTFRYRGVRHVCLPGQCHVLHPDETHDGAAATDEGFSYRIIYADPALIQQALAGRRLPFVRDPIIPGRALSSDVSAAIQHVHAEIDDVTRVELAIALAGMLDGAAEVADRRTPVRLAALHRVRALIASEPAVRHTAAAFEAVSGLDRWTLVRQFRAAFGTSPRRFRSMRQLDHARHALRTGGTLAEVALTAGFADQSHLFHCHDVISSALCVDRPHRHGRACPCHQKRAAATTDGRHGGRP